MRSPAVPRLRLPFLAVLFLLGCRSGAWNKPEAVDWPSFEERGEYKYFLGLSTPAKTLADARKLAEMDAAREAAQYLGVEITSRVETRNQAWVERLAEGYRDEFESEITEKTPPFWLEEAVIADTASRCVEDPGDGKLRYESMVRLRVPRAVFERADRVVDALAEGQEFLEGSPPRPLEAIERLLALRHEIRSSSEQLELASLTIRASAEQLVGDLAKGLPADPPPIWVKPFEPDGATPERYAAWLETAVAFELEEKTRTRVLLTPLPPRGRHRVLWARFGTGIRLDITDPGHPSGSPTCHASLRENPLLGLPEPRPPPHPRKPLEIEARLAVFPRCLDASVRHVEVGREGTVLQSGDCYRIYLESSRRARVAIVLEAGRELSVLAPGNGSHEGISLGARESAIFPSPAGGGPDSYRLDETEGREILYFVASEGSLEELLDLPTRELARRLRALAARSASGRRAGPGGASAPPSSGRFVVRRFAYEHQGR